MHTPCYNDSIITKHTPYLKVDRQVEKVVFPIVLVINLVQKQLDRVLVRNVLYHQSRPAVLLDLTLISLTTPYQLRMDYVHVRVLVRYRLPLSPLVLLAILKLARLMTRDELLVLQLVRVSQTLLC